MKIPFTKDKFRKIIDNDIYVAYVNSLTYNCYTDYEDVEGNICLGFVNEFDSDDEYILPWDNIRGIEYNPSSYEFTIYMDNREAYDVMLLTLYKPRW